MHIRSFRRTATLGLVGLALATTSGCFGSFQAVRKVYAFNKEVSNDKFVREIVFLAFSIIPVYGVAGFFDVIVLNSIEFWTGDNPLASANTIDTQDGRRVATRQIVTETQRQMIVEEFVNDALVSTSTMTLVNGASEMTITTVYADGRTETKTVSVDEGGAPTVE